MDKPEPEKTYDLTKDQRYYQFMWDVEEWFWSQPPTCVPLQVSLDVIKANKVEHSDSP